MLDEIYYSVPKEKRYSKILRITLPPEPGFSFKKRNEKLIDFPFGSADNEFPVLFILIQFLKMPIFKETSFLKTIISPLEGEMLGIKIVFDQQTVITSQSIMKMMLILLKNSDNKYPLLKCTTFKATPFEKTYSKTTHGFLVDDMRLVIVNNEEADNDEVAVEFCIKNCKLNNYLLFIDIFLQNSMLFPNREAFLILEDGSILIHTPNLREDNDESLSKRRIRDYVKLIYCYTDPFICKSHVVDPSDEDLVVNVGLSYELHDKDSELRFLLHDGIPSVNTQEINEIIQSICWQQYGLALESSKKEESLFVSMNSVIKEITNLQMVKIMLFVDIYKGFKMELVKEAINNVLSRCLSKSSIPLMNTLNI